MQVMQAKRAEAAAASGMHGMNLVRFLPTVVVADSIRHRFTVVAAMTVVLATHEWLRPATTLQAAAGTLKPVANTTAVHGMAPTCLQMAAVVIILTAT
jgi:hypothetical protein